MKITKKKLTIALLLLPLLYFVIINRAVFLTGKLNFRSTEEPFISLEQPFQQVDVALVADGNNPVLVRIVDASGREIFLLVLKKNSSGKYAAVIKDPQAEWWADGIGGAGFANIKTPSSIVEAESSYDLLGNPNDAIIDIINIIEKYGRDDGRSHFGYNALKSGN